MERDDESHCLDLAFSDFMWYPVDKGQVLWLRMPVAMFLGLHVTGTLGVLLRAKGMGLVEEYL